MKLSSSNLYSDNIIWRLKTEVKKIELINWIEGVWQNYKVSMSKEKISQVQDMLKAFFLIKIC